MSNSEKGSISQNEAADELVDGLSKVSLDEGELSSKIRTLQRQLNALECPFTWWTSLTLCSNERNLSRVEAKRAEIHDEEIDEDFRWCTFALDLVLCYEYHKKGRISESLAKQMECEEILNAKPKGDAGSIPSVGLWHVCLACKCFVQFESGQYVQAEQTLVEIRLPVQMTETEQASLWGCRAAFCMEYGDTGTKEALHHAEKALRLDPEQGEWHFLLGKAMGRMRRVDNYSSIPDNKELKALQKAVDLTNNPSHIIFLAQVYRETGFRLFSHHREHKYKDISTSMHKRSVELFRNVLELKKDNSNINIRCAQGFLKLPKPYRNVALAKECIDRTLSLSPNNAMAHHIAGLYFERHGNDLEQAKKHYSLAGEKGAYGAWMDLFRIKYQQDDRYNPVPDLERLLELHQETPRQQETLCQLGSLYYFIKNDLKTALGYWQTAMALAPESAILQNHKSSVFNMKNPVNIHELVLDEARLIIQSNTGSDEDHAMWRKLISDYAKSHPDLGRWPPVSRQKMVLDEGKKTRRGGRSQSGRGRGKGCN